MRGDRRRFQFVTRFPFATQLITVLAAAGGVMLLSCDVEPRPASTATAADGNPTSKPTGGRAAATITPPGPTSWASFRNGTAQRGVAGSKLPDKLDLLWKRDDVDGFVATAAVVGEFVYAAALSGNLYCLDRKSGTTLWKYRSIDDPDPNTFAPGFKSAPTVTADTVFVGDEDGTLHAVSRKTGKAIWKFETGGEIVGGVAVQGKNIIVGSHDSNLYCLQAAAGTLVWKFQTMDRINCSPAIVEGYTFVAGCDEHMRVINLKNGEQKSDIPLDSYLIASPAVSGEMLYVGTYAGEVLAVNWKTATIVWRYSDPVHENPYHASAAVTDKYVIVGGQDKQLHCIDRKTGERVWAFVAKGQINSSPVVVGDRVAFGSNDRNVYVVSLKTGKPLWRYNTGGGITAGPAVGENVLVIGTAGSNGTLFCFGAK